MITSIAIFLSFIIVAFGQPARSEVLSLIAATIGFALFWKTLLPISSAKKRFLLGTGWFTAIQLIQLSWFLSHVYSYIYGVWILCSLFMGLQWGILSLWMQPRMFSSLFSLLAFSGCWVLLEWSRLFILSGLPFNPVGLELSASAYSIQFAALGGVYLLSFWVILTNVLLLRAWMNSSIQQGVFFVLVALFPYAFGWIHFAFHASGFAQNHQTVRVALVQPFLPIEENIHFTSAEEFRIFVLQQWEQALLPLQKEIGQPIDLIVFPEYLVPYGTFHSVFPSEEVQSLFEKLFGKSVEKDFFSKKFISNANIGQMVANLFQSHVIIGLEDTVYANSARTRTKSYSAAFHFIPNSDEIPICYEKRILVPMGEYIPFTWCRKWAARYGITSSFTPGKKATLFNGPVPFGVCICYEEIYGNLMRENRRKGAELLVNITNDGWYPNSLLPKQHFDHAKLRTVENGMPLIRACNTGMTAAIDSLGRIIGILPSSSPDLLRVSLPLYHYSTLYSLVGDAPVIAFSAFFSLGKVWVKTSKFFQLINRLAQKFLALLKSLSMKMLLLKGSRQ